MEQRQEEADLAPSKAQALGVERDLVGKIAGPDDEPLREAEVCPNHDEGHDPLAMVVDEIRLQHLRHGLVVEENAFNHDREAHGREHFADEDDEAEDGRNPAGVERHDPVNRGEGDGEGVKDEAGPGYGFKFLRVVRCTGAIGLARPHREQEGQHIPDHEVDDGANDEARLVQVRVLNQAVLFQMLADVGVLNRFGGHRPGINAVLHDSDDDRNEENREQRQGAHGSTEDGADDHSPSATSQGTDHHDGHRAKRHGQPAQEYEQIAAIELVGIGDSDDDGRDRKNNADALRALIDL